MKQFIPDQRAVAPLVGGILLFGFFVIGLSIYQVQIVPQENKEVEFQHSQSVQDDLIELRDTIHINGNSVVSRGTSVTLGANYNPRIIAINPPSPAGTISTIDPTQNISVIPNSDNTTAAENLTTKFIQYEPQYSEYQDAPTTRIEHSLLYNTFSETDTPLLVSGQRMFGSDELVIPILEGDVLETQTNAVSVRLTALEREEQSINDNVTVILPTDAPQLWVNEIETQSHVRLVEQTETSVTFEANVSTLTLYRIETDEVPQDDPTNSLAERFDELVPDGPIFCTVCDGTDDEETTHETINKEDGFENETLVIPEGTDFVPPENPDGNDQNEDVEYEFASYEIGGNVTTNEKITMTATDGEINFGSSGSAISGAQLDLVANGDNGSINVDGATIETTAEDGGNVPGQGRNGIKLETTGDISATNTTMETNADVLISAEGSVDLTDATINVTSNNDITIESGDGPEDEIILNRTRLNIEASGGGTSASAEGTTVFVEDAVFEGNADPLEIISGEVIGEPTEGTVDE